jgi:peptide/nickel transport system substrate-binding protein
VGVRNGINATSYLSDEEPFVWGPSGGWEARLAEAVPTLDNGGLRWLGQDASRHLVMRVRLREGLRWPDGEPITADDLLFAHGLLSHPDFPVFDRGLLDKLAAVKKLGPLEAEYRFKPGPPDLRYADAARIAPRHRLAAIPPAQWLEHPDAQDSPHAGPFRRVGGEANVHAEYAAQAGYALGAPGLKRLVLRDYADHFALLQAARQGRVGIASFGYHGAELLPELKALAAKGRHQLHQIPALSGELLVPNLDHPFLREAPVRRALLLAVDRAGAIKSLLNSAAGLPHSWLPPGDPLADAGLPLLPHDPQQARRLLAEAGFKEQADGVLARDSRRFEVEVWFAAGNKTRERLMQAVARDWKAIGVLARLKIAPNSQVYARDQRSVMVRRAFDFLVWQVTLASDQPYSLMIWHSSAIPDEANRHTGQNYAGWRSSASDRLIEKALGSLDPQARRRALFEHQRLFTQEWPALPLYSHSLIHLSDRRLQGIKPGPLVIHPITWNAAQWRWQEKP